MTSSQSPPTRSLTERFLSLFTEVRAGEATTVLLLTLNIFLILTAYYIAKVVCEPLIFTGGDAEVKAYSFARQTLILVSRHRHFLPAKR